MPLLGKTLDAPADLRTVLAAGLARDPDAPAVIAADDAMTWRALDTASTRLASSYLELGLARGDRIASLMPNRIALLVHYLACFKTGLVSTPLNYRYTAPEIDHALGVSGAVALVAHAERGEDLAASRLVPGLRVVVEVEGDGASGRPRFDALCADGSPDRPLTPAELTDPAAIFFTSGSTGPAKGVTHTLETLGWMTASAAAAFELTESDRFVPASSMSHVGSFLWSLATLSAGAQVVIARTFDAGEVLPLLREHKPTVLSMIPAALTALIRDHGVTKEDFASLRLCRAGADKVSLELEREFSELAGFFVDEGYGMTEVGLATLNPPSGVIKVGSIGVPIAGVNICVRGDDQQELTAGTVGRVWIQTPGQTVGYWQDPGASAEILREGWLDSGDLAHADEDGYLWFYGRKKQIIVHDGSNISPQEVEDALDQHPAVALAGVVGIHDAVHGETVRAYVTVKDGVPTPTSQELIDFAREEIGYKAPEEVVFIDEMPLNPTGKVDRVTLKRIAEEHVHAQRERPAADG